MSATLQQDYGIVDGMGIINFSEDKTTFGKDLSKFLLMLAKRKDVRKICFSVAVGNPIEESYDKMIKKYNGTIVGIKKSHIKMFDGEYADKKMYEIFTDEIRKVLRRRMWKPIEI